MADAPKDVPLPGERSPLLSFLVTVVMFIGGGLAGVGLGMWVAPDSPVAQFVAFLVLPVSFIASMVLWQGLTLVLLLFRMLRRRQHNVPNEAVQMLRRKAVVMIPVPVLICVPAGLLVGLLGDGVVFGAVLFAAVGLGYGFGLWALAQRDLLPLLDSE